MSVFIGRDAEKKQLKDFILNPGSSIAVIYGRRRVGKSELIKHVCSKYTTIRFEGLENKGKQLQIKNFLFQLKQQFPIDAKEIKQWDEALILLKPFTAKGRVVLVLDEFQWMANYRDELIVILKMIWEQYLSVNPKFKIILCGSIASFMISKVIKSSALYGRTDCIIQLEQFHLHEVRSMLINSHENDALEAAMILGGIPKYLELVQKYPTFLQGIDALAFKKGGYFVEEYERIFTSHFGKNPEYGRIVECLAEHPYGLSMKKIVEYTNLPAGGSLSRCIENLESAGFLHTYRPFNMSSRSKLINCVLIDSYMRFYFSFIKPHVDRGITFRKNINYFQQISQSPQYFSWLGRSFEYLCLNHTEIISGIAGFGGISYSVGPYFKRGSNDTKGTQIDLVFDRSDRILTLCEMKYTSSAPGCEVIDEVQRKVSVLQEHFPNRSISRILITRNRPTRDLAKRDYFSHIILAQDLFSKI